MNFIENCKHSAIENKEYCCRKLPPGTKLDHYVRGSDGNKEPNVSTSISGRTILLYSTGEESVKDAVDAQRLGLFQVAGGGRKDEKMQFLFRDV